MKVNLVIRHKPVKCENPDCIYGGEATMGQVCMDILPDGNYGREWYCFHPECFAAFLLTDSVADRLLRTLRRMNEVGEAEKQEIRT